MLKQYFKNIQKIIYKHKHDFHFIRKYEWKEIKKLLDPKQNEVILDLACGNGFYVNKLANCGCKVSGVDLDEKRINYANYYHKTGGCEFVFGNAEKLPFKKDSFNKVFSLCALEHFKNPEKALSEVYRVLRHSGKAVFSVDSFSYHHIKEDFKEWHRRKYRVANYFELPQLKRLSEKAGFHFIEGKYILHSRISHLFYTWALRRNCTGIPFLLIFPFAYTLVIASDWLSAVKNGGYILIIAIKK